MVHLISSPFYLMVSLYLHLPSQSMELLYPAMILKPGRKYVTVYEKGALRMKPVAPPVESGGCGRDLFPQGDSGGEKALRFPHGRRLHGCRPKFVPNTTYCWHVSCGMIKISFRNSRKAEPDIGDRTASGKAAESAQRSSGKQRHMRSEDSKNKFYKKV